MIYKPAYIVNPVGIDKHIQEMQEYLSDNQTVIEWVFGRAYNNFTTDGIRKELYFGNGEYKEIYAIDKIKSMLYFDVASTINVTDTNSLYLKEADIKVIVFANLDKIYTDKVHRADEDLRIAVETAIKDSPYSANWELNRIINNIDEIYDNYEFRDKQIINMQPTIVFALNYTMRYNNEC